MTDLFPLDQVHIIGIGGAGMSAIARILLESGAQVSGSDRTANDLTRSLAQAGAVIYEGHNAEHIAGTKVVLISSAVKDDNPEIVAAKAAGLPILDRREAFRYLLPDKLQIAVAGTKGKTTTAALIIHLLRELGRDPSYIVGGTLLNTGDNAHVGKGDAFVVEADEYGYMFLGLKPKIAVITNIEHDHPDMFPTRDAMVEAFHQFLDRLDENGIYIAGFDAEAKALGAALLEAGRRVGQFDEPPKFIAASLPDTLIGEHNIKNAALALATMSAYLELSDVNFTFDRLLESFKTFKGVARRFEILGKTANQVTIVSDYGHHPMAIRATLEGARARYPQAHFWAVWQPHTYSRTKTLAPEFVEAFQACDHALVMNIYAAREVPIPGTPTETELAQQIALHGPQDARASGGLESTAELLSHEAQPGDWVIIFSAGDAPIVGNILLGHA
jgi:UDP-N-acetylmuramate--alanine ligase